MKTCAQCTVPASLELTGKPLCMTHGIIATSESVAHLSKVVRDVVTAPAKPFPVAGAFAILLLVAFVPIAFGGGVGLFVVAYRWALLLGPGGG